MHLRYRSQHMATNVTNSFFQRLPTFIWLVFGHTISVQRLYTFYEVFVVSPSCFQSLILHLHSHVSKSDELCKEQTLLNVYIYILRHFINIYLCLKYIIKIFLVWCQNFWIGIIFSDSKET